MLNKFEEFLKSTCKIEESSNTSIVAVDIKYSLIISITANNRTLIAHKNNNDMRFNGIIENVHQLKLLLQLIRKGI